jgi:hypothetical protein
VRESLYSFSYSGDCTRVLSVSKGYTVKSTITAARAPAFCLLVVVVVVWVDLQCICQSCCCT